MAKGRRKKAVTGLGDVISKITETVGIEECDGCKKRKEKLNKLFPFGVLEPTEEEAQFLRDWFSIERKDISPKDQKTILSIYFRCFKLKPFDPCIGCSGVWKNILEKLKTLNYED